jgi:hypothetical protein
MEPTKRIAKTVAWLFGSLLVVVVCADCVLDVVNFLYVRKAEQLLRETGSLRVGLSTEADAHKVLDKYGSAGSQTSGFCRSSNTILSANVTNHTLDWLGRRSPMLRPFGNRNSGADVIVLIDAGQVCAVLYSVRADFSDLSGEGDAEVYDLSNQSGSVFLNSQLPYFTHVHTIKGYSFISAELTPNATSVQRQRALGFDLSCLTRLGGCRQPCEILPAVWSDVEQRARVEGWDLPAEETTDPQCSKLATPP